VYGEDQILTIASGLRQQGTSANAAVKLSPRWVRIPRGPTHSDKGKRGFVILDLVD
jgi:hypothetical protein